MLRKKSKPVKFGADGLFETDKKLLKNLLDTASGQKEPEGAGLSAPQIGVGKRIFVFRKAGKMQEGVNPVVLSTSKETNFTKLGKENCTLEGCLSVPDIYGEVERPWEAVVSYQDRTGKAHGEKLEGIEATCFLHELDHLDGTLFIDCVLKQGGQLFEIKGDTTRKIELI